MIRILHAADLHLDSPFESLPSEKAAIRRSEQRELLRSLAQLRAQYGAQLVLLPGDLFDSRKSWGRYRGTAVPCAGGDGGTGLHLARKSRFYAPNGAGRG